jgi:hypothetical protein
VITFEQFEAWALEQGIAPRLATHIEFVYAHVAGRTDAVMYLRSTQIVEDERGKFVWNTTKNDALTEVVTVPMVSLP